MAKPNYVFKKRQKELAKKKKKEEKRLQKENVGDSQEQIVQPALDKDDIAIIPEDTEKNN